ncbi:bifunctional diguanylate cyclase/phosphodiesterase [Sulfurimonas microaerophilic]|uniref:bifunctional diguanylate cyclase/phosphodiesterase n=1 Tax=Sulfurimonas microaerophilic TaxID=3058392 RepID=UPI0027145F05|nr:GGDEF domain-containing phosphodiesterase [Sulfurimonas sp. hsl 1-7]
MRTKLKDYFSFITSDFFNLGPMVSFVWKNDANWSIETVSGNIKENFHYDPKEFLEGELVYIDLVHKDDIERVKNEVQNACKKREKSFTHEPYRIKNGNGEDRWVQDTTTIFYDEDENITHFIGYLIDVTEGEQNLIKAIKNEEKLQAAQALANLGNWDYDVANDQLFWSDEVYKLFELDKAITTPSYELFLNAVHPDDRKLVDKAYANSLEKKKKYLIQHRLLMKDNRIKYVEETGEHYYDKDGNAIKTVGTIQDITHQKEVEIELEKTLSLFKSHKLAMDESSIVSKSDRTGNITYVNDNFCRITGYTRTEVLGRPHNILRHPDNPKSLFRDLWKTIEAKKVWKQTLKNKDKFGEDYWVDIVILPILDEEDNIIEYIAVRHDVTKMIEQQKQLDEMLNTDLLTGLGSRYKLVNDIQESTQGALAILNIDNFSQINDFYGHEVGDYVIKEFGQKMGSCKCDLELQVYHLQGDEYVIFHPRIEPKVFSNALLALKEEISKVQIDIDGELITFNFSMSISYEPKEKLLTTADMALRIAKRHNQDIVTYHDDISLNDEYKNNIKWTKKIKEAIANDNIVPVFQPIVNNKNGKWEKYECLVRLKDNEQLISPFFFLDIAKKTKHYIEITQIMIEKSFAVFHEKDVEFSLNLTIEDILNDEIKSFICKMLQKYSIGERVVFEIVESESIENFDEVLEFIRNVKNYGCKIAIDDFGTGYSNFEYLMRLKTDYIKIDGSLIKDIDTNIDAELVVSTIVDFAKKMGIKTIAEFVENEEILLKVKELGIGYSQGYHCSKPLSTIPK